MGIGPNPYFTLYNLKKKICLYLFFRLSVFKSDKSNEVDRTYNSLI